MGCQATIGMAEYSGHETGKEVKTTKCGSKYKGPPSSRHKLNCCVRSCGPHTDIGDPCAVQDYVWHDSPLLLMIRWLSRYPR